MAKFERTSRFGTEIHAECDKGWLSVHLTINPHGRSPAHCASVAMGDLMDNIQDIAFATNFKQEPGADLAGMIISTAMEQFVIRSDGKGNWIYSYTFYNQSN